MMHHRLVVLVMLGALAAGGCRRQPPEPPGPTQEELDAEAARLAAEEAARQRAADEAARRRAEEAGRVPAGATDELASLRAVLTEMVHFDYDRFNIQAEAAAVLTRKMAVLRANPSVRLRISGHADERGSTEYNLALGMRRATAVRTFLMQYGIDGGRLDVMSYGEERPLVHGTSEDAYAQNRRAEFEIIGGTLSVSP
jgi:peptidoglycan-associated lipoprotein